MLSSIIHSVRWCVVHPWLAYLFTFGAMIAFMSVFPLLPMAPHDVKGALEIESKVQPIFFGLCYAWYVVGVGKLAGRPWPHFIFALVVASIHMFPFWEMKQLNAASDHHPWGTWEQASTLGTLVITFLGIPIFANWLCANRIPGWRADDYVHTPAKSSHQI